jgi:hypothetical protein
MLAVIIGAGASCDCADAETGEVNEDYRPPLVKDLFRVRRSFNALLKKYPKAEQLSTDIRARLRQNIGLETILKEMQSRKSLTLQKQYWQVPLYLRDLFLQVSNTFVAFGGTRFDHLVTVIENSDYENVFYITLNYDLFLEQSLRSLYGADFCNLDMYVEDSRDWSLVKLHGSVNWGRRVRPQPPPNSTQLVPYLDSLLSALELDEEVCFCNRTDGRPEEDGTLYYPALAVPIEGKTNFSCPSAFVEQAREFLRCCTDFLVIGFSALDSHVLDLFKVVQHVRKIKVVNGSGESGTDALQRIAGVNDKFGRLSELADTEPMFDGKFRDFLEQGRLEKFLSQ